MRAATWLLAVAWPLAAFRDADFEGEISAALAADEALRGESARGSGSTGGSAGHAETVDGAAADPEEASPGGDEPGMFEAVRRNVTLEPGASGIVLYGNARRIVSLAPDSQANKKGVREGEFLVAVNGAPYSPGQFLRLENGKVPYNLTVASPSGMVTFLQQAALPLSIPAGLMGCVSICCGIPFYRAHQRMGPDWQDDLLARFLIHPAALFSVGATVCRAVLRAFLAASDQDEFEVLRQTSYAVQGIGLLHCLFGISAIPLLATRLSETAMARWRRENKWFWLAATFSSLIRVGRAAYHYMYMSQGVQDRAMWEYVFYMLSWTMIDLLLAEVLTVSTRVVGAVEHRILQIQNALSCKPTDFLEQIHVPCAELVNDTGPQLTPLGYPLFYLSMVMLPIGWRWYLILKMLVTVDSAVLSIGTHILAVADDSINLAARAFAITVGPFRVSSAMGKLFDRLGELRCNASDMHVHVQAVEAMLERANAGHGWGIKVQGVVLNRTFFQTAGLRTAVMTGAVFAFLNQKMGFEKSQKEIVTENHHLLMTILKHLHKPE